MQRHSNSSPWLAFVASGDGMPGSQPMLNLTDQSWVLVGGNWIPAAQDGWVLSRAVGVNPAGWVVGYGTKGGQTRAFVLVPKQH